MLLPTSVRTRSPIICADNVTTFDCLQHAYYRFGAPFLASAGSAWTFASPCALRAATPSPAGTSAASCSLPRTLQVGQRLFQRLRARAHDLCVGHVFRKEAAQLVIR